MTTYVAYTRGSTMRRSDQDTALVEQRRANKLSSLLAALFTGF